MLGGLTMNIFDDFDANGGIYSGIPTLNGNVDIMHDGMLIDTVKGDGSHTGDMVVKNVMGGKDIYHNGMLKTHTQPNVMGGEDIYHGGSLERISIPNQEGGVDYYDSNYHHEGHTVKNIFGGEDYISNFSNEHEIMSYDNPLQHVNKLRFPHMDWNK